MTTEEARLYIGWAQNDITPLEPVLIAGQFHARVWEGVDDPITTTALAIDTGSDHLVFVSCDLVAISEDLRDAVRTKLEQLETTEGLDPSKVILHATHTHTGPETRVPRKGANYYFDDVGIVLPVLPVGKYLQFAAERISATVSLAWSSRSPGGFAFGQGYAVVGRNRRWVDKNGRSTMYGDTGVASFSHIEGYEDHSVNVLATYSEDGELSGLLVNVPCPSQVSELEFRLSADYWYETRRELRNRLGENLPILVQCSAAGDQSPHLLFDQRASERMQSLSGRTERQEIAQRISGAVEEILHQTRQTIDCTAILVHVTEKIDLPTTIISEQESQKASQEAASLRRQYEEEKQRLDTDLMLRKEARWYTTITALYRRICWLEDVVARHEQQPRTLPVELHVVRLGDVVFATNPFEYYLDFGIHIKARSRAVQTFLVQLAGSGGYVPSRRSTQGGGYGSIPASSRIGYQGGWEFADRTVAIIDSLWK
ncbi:MAG: hypothetical protein HXS50_00105 [Theionarchaea archaeon]|nr:hypothetical protein [Theionarchaea archaeon]